MDLIKTPPDRLPSVLQERVCWELKEQERSSWFADLSQASNLALHPKTPSYLHRDGAVGQVASQGNRGEQAHHKAHPAMWLLLVQVHDRVHVARN